MACLMCLPEPATPPPTSPLPPQGSARRLHWMSWLTSSGRNCCPTYSPCSRASSSTPSGWSRSRASWCWAPLLRVSDLPAWLRLTSDPHAGARLGLAQAGLWGATPSPGSLQRPAHLTPNSSGI